MCTINYRSLNCRRPGTIAAGLMLLICSMAPSRQACADPITLRGPEDVNIFKGQAVFNATAPAAAADFQAPPPPIGALAGAAGTMAAGAGAAHLVGGLQRQRQNYHSESGNYDSRPVTAVRPQEHRTYFQQHPKVRAALIGAGVGTAAGAVTGLITHRGVFRGAAIGAGAGAGVGLIRSSQTLNRHPIVKDLATGAVAGLGLGMAGSHRGGGIGKLTAVGAALGLGVGVLRNKLK